ncbi:MULTISPECIES: twin-arginine translocase subunit TatC [Cytobacillus]|uniref:Sec-independent protein translocase protein TatC n=1 Tax=Cytobacillus stercorigallinarum TaxID=2762240 RepID=A0ABR8QKX6_9BACI|nr:twin-arginine translocase subunit TatC [Cytobacillus stercorigallinarum]MBD7936178.1 twin-arginine translocase subunit TatC [Cytobacillus stercorigallinarum]
MKQEELNYIEHLEELRKRLILCIVAFVLFFIVGFLFVDHIYQWFVRDLKEQLIVLGPSDIIWVYFTIASVIAIAGTIPVVAFQLWQFVKPGLVSKERKITLAYIPALFVLFLAGLSFGYFVIMPTLFNFLTGLSEGMMEMSFTVDKYFQFIFHMTLPFGILFELPVVAMFLTSLGIINPYVLTKVRKYAYFVLVVISVIISPPDLMSDIIVSIPLLFLYEISITLSKIVYRRKLKKEQLEALESSS